LCHVATLVNTPGTQVGDLNLVSIPPKSSVTQDSYTLTTQRCCPSSQLIMSLDTLAVVIISSQHGIFLLK
jgi:hypothetical protein